MSLGRSSNAKGLPSAISPVSITFTHHIFLDAAVELVPEFVTPHVFAGCHVPFDQPQKGLPEGGHSEIREEANTNEPLQENTQARVREAINAENRLTYRVLTSPV